ncbi:Protein of unknown function [Pyronema omphalodes CBS 100304]|uniref:Uncharacterized protein n=1 Tax=Pyronema omphalodes (strain CBS 100304) TaxID=1076935 RepID=U4LG31_PYROM|nr:Protein of unknown function [Pyronema omphalodes CBS 100304]
MCSFTITANQPFKTPFGVYRFYIAFFSPTYREPCSGLVLPCFLEYLTYACSLVKLGVWRWQLYVAWCGVQQLRV